MWNSGWAHHAMYGDGSWFAFWGMHGFASLFFLALAVFLVVYVIRAFATDKRGHDPALTLLGEKYANGDISREEYLQKKKDLEG